MRDSRLSFHRGRKAGRGDASSHGGCDGPSRTGRLGDVLLPRRAGGTVPSTALHPRPLTRRSAADVLRGQVARPFLQLGGVQLPGDPRGSRGDGTRVPRRFGHGGDAGGIPRVGRGFRGAPVHRHVRLRAVECGDTEAVPRPRPARDQAALSCAAPGDIALRLRDEGAPRVPGLPAGGGPVRPPVFPRVSVRPGAARDIPER